MIFAKSNKNLSYIKGVLRGVFIIPLNFEMNETIQSRSVRSKTQKYI